MTLNSIQNIVHNDSIQSFLFKIWGCAEKFSAWPIPKILGNDQT